MTSRSLSSKPFGGLLIETLRRNIWAFALSVLCFLFTLPLPVAMMLQNSTRREQYGNLTEEQIRVRALDNIRSFFGIDNAFVKMAMVALAVICGVALFRYLHSRQQTDFYHAMPVKRQTLFAVNFTAGILIVLPAFLVCLLLAGAIAAAGGYGEAFFAADTATMLIVNMVFFLLLYALSVLCTILCGNTIVSLLLTGWTFFSASAAIALFIALQQQFYSTFAGASEMVSRAMTRLSPVIQYFSVMESVQGYSLFGASGTGQTAVLTPLLILYFIAALLIAALACLLFVRRKSERAGSAIAFEGLKAPLKFWCTAVMAVAVGMLFVSMVNDSWLVFGLAVGGLMTHCLMEMIYAFDFRAALRHWKSFVIFAVILGAGGAVLKFDLTGYNRFVPEASAVKTAAIESYGGARGTYLDRAHKQEGETVFADLTDPKNIEDILALAHLGVDNRIWDDSYDGSTYSLYVYYELSGGRKVSRRYLLPSELADEQAAPLLREIRDSEEYITKRAEVFTYEMTGKERLRAFTRADGDNSKVDGFTDDQAQIGEIIRTLREEMLAADQRELARTVPVMHLDMLTLSAEDNDGSARPDGATYVSGRALQTAMYTSRTDAMLIYPQYTKTLALIAQYTGVQPKKLAVEEIVSATLNLYEADSDDMKTDTETDSDSSEQMRSVTDPADILALLQNALDDGYIDFSGSEIELTPYVLEDAGFNVTFTLKDGTNAGVYYPEGRAPEAVFEKYYNR